MAALLGPQKGAGDTQCFGRVSPSTTVRPATTGGTNSIATTWASLADSDEECDDGEGLDYMYQQLDNWTWPWDPVPPESQTEDQIESVKQTQLAQLIAETEAMAKKFTDEELYQAVVKAEIEERLRKKRHRKKERPGRVPGLSG